uniref:Integrase core domain n=1 Tax=Clostridioides difficile TaxID=1496 RepID=V5ZEJ3_CLODI|nr:integrase core domain fragment [Clostridioides difficile]
MQKLVIVRHTKGVVCPFLSHITIQKQLSELFLYGKQTRVIWKDEKTCNKKISI